MEAKDELQGEMIFPIEGLVELDCCGYVYVVETPTTTPKNINIYKHKSYKSLLFIGETMTFLEMERLYHHG
jgi:hypothetical protein